MNYLLKIIEGPAKGAEIALVPGTTLKFGSGAECDIVLGDATVEAVAGQLEVGEDGVTLVTPSGKGDRLSPFEIRDFGTTALAVGPADGDWRQVVRKAPAVEPEKSVPKPVPESPVSAPAEPDATPHQGHSAVIWLILLVLIVVAAIGAIWLWPRGRAEALKVYRDICAPKAVVVAPAVPRLSLAQIAAEHHLKLETKGAAKSLSGNLKRRTERFAIRALALAADPSVKLDITDDETLKVSANELLFAATDGALTVDAANDRKLTLSGYAPSAEALARALKALTTDVPQVAALDTSRVRVGGVPPPRVAKTPFATVPETALPQAVPSKVAPRKDYPIAGILTTPYPCVVMRNGARLVEGAVVGTAVLKKIEADRLTLKDGNTTFTWRP